MILSASCQLPSLQFNITSSVNIDNIPSGSGIARINERCYVVGDDSPFIYELDSQYQVLQKISLSDTLDFASGRMAKDIKPDYEVLELINEHELVIFGSGSKSPQRNRMIRVLLKNEPIVEQYEISEFYEKLQSLELWKASALNIEAAAYKNNKIYLFNRNQPLVISFDYSELLAYIQKKDSFPTYDIIRFQLPELRGVSAGFSGAVAMQNEDKIIFTASVENTDNAYDDGEILGSFIGVLNISEGQIRADYRYTSVPNVPRIWKVESVAIEDETNAHLTKIVLITDNDDGQSTIIRGDLRH